MAFQKSVIIPGGYSANYFSIVKQSTDEDARISTITLKVFKDAAAYNANEPGTLCAELHFESIAFDLYFSKAALVALNVNPYAAVYQALSDYTAAILARNALAVVPQPVPAPPALTDKQTAIIAGCFMQQAGPQYGGELLLAGSVLA